MDTDTGNHRIIGLFHFWVVLISVQSDTATYAVLFK